MTLPNDCYVSFDSTRISCGVLQMYHLFYEPKQHMIELYEALHRDSPSQPAFVIFSDRVDKESSRNGPNLYKYIKANEKHFGEVTASKTKLNPNSHNRIRIWTLALNFRGLQLWYHLNVEGK